MAKPLCKAHRIRGCSTCRSRANSSSYSDTLDTLFLVTSYDTWDSGSSYDSSSSYDSGSSSSSSYSDSGSSSDSGSGGSCD